MSQTEQIYPGIRTDSEINDRREGRNSQQIEKSEPTEENTDESKSAVNIPRDKCVCVCVCVALFLVVRQYEHLTMNSSGAI
jgi:hypothetical protein